MREEPQSSFQKQARVAELAYLLADQQFEETKRRLSVVDLELKLCGIAADKAREVFVAARIAELGGDHDG